MKKTHFKIYKYIINLYSKTSKKININLNAFECAKCKYIIPRYVTIFGDLKWERG